MVSIGKWEYTGDANLEYGGFYIDLSDWKHGYCTAVRVTDLDSGCGFTGACLIEHVVINGTTDAKRLRQAMRSCGCSAQGMDKRSARLMLAEALAEYGYTDPDDSWDGYQSHHSEVVQMEPEGPMTFDGWKADKRLRGTDLKEYVESVHLS